MRTLAGGRATDCWPRSYINAVFLYVRSLFNELACLPFLSHINSNDVRWVKWVKVSRDVYFWNIWREKSWNSRSHFVPIIFLQKYKIFNICRNMIDLYSPISTHPFTLHVCGVCFSFNNYSVNLHAEGENILWNACIPFLHWGFPRRSIPLCGFCLALDSLYS